MRIVGVTGASELAIVYMAEFSDERLLEFVEALQPPYSRDQRWILMVSTMFGCPVKCGFCDAGGTYRGKPTAHEMLAQIDHMVDRWYPDRRVPATKFKIQFARMGEPTLNPMVLDVLEALPSRYDAPGLIPSLSTIAPRGGDRFLERLVNIKNNQYPNGRFQFQFSIHTTDTRLRDRLIPVRKWDFSEMAAYGDRFWQPGDRKLTLNFALAAGMPVDADTLLWHFDPERYLIKITPVNPTLQAQRNKLTSYLSLSQNAECHEIGERLANRGFEVIVSIGELEENQIGSNCGQYVLNYLRGKVPVEGGYSYPVMPAMMDQEAA